MAEARRFKAVIVDDDKDCVQSLSYLILSNCPEIDIRGLAENNVEDGVKLVQEQKPDILFLDVNMPPYTGFDLLKQINNKDMEVIFCTSSSDYAVQAFKYAAFDYLLKPVTVSDLRDSIDRLNEKKIESSLFDERMILLTDQLSPKVEKNGIIAFATFNEYIFVHIDQVVYINADGNYTKVLLDDDRKLMISKNLRYYEEILPQKISYECIIPTS